MIDRGAAGGRGRRPLVRVALDVSIQGWRPPLGTERAQATLVTALAARGEHQLVLLSPGDVPASLADLAAAHDGRSPLPRAVWREAVLPGLLRRHDVRLLHAPVAAIPLHAPCPTVATVHDLPWVRYSRRAGGRLADRAGLHLRHRVRTALAARRAARLLCVSGRTRDDLVASHPACERRTRVVPHGVDPRFSPARDDTEVPREDAPYVLAVGALRHRKNLSTLLAAMRAPALAGHRLVLVGPADAAEPALRQRARELSLTGRVGFTGFVDDDALVSLYRRADVVVHPATQEGFGLPVLEAMACGTPVVCCAQGAAEEARGHAARVFDAADGPDAVAAHIAALLDETECARARRRGLEHAASMSADAMAARVSVIYEELA